ncbi:MAG: pyruvate ferredoxin oxidoreductase alpha subunit [Natronomonas sp.]|jgi:pyruvate ferredoxin oxidoreductase alpha subunit
MSDAVAKSDRQQEESNARIMTGNAATALAARDAGTDVVAAYPITPQTEIVENIAEAVESGEFDAEFSRVESEHSAMAACMGASQANARTFTATASQGLLFMSEMVWWTAASRLPVVMSIANRALGPPWNIWASHTDALSQRDSGWIQFFAGTVQEVYDLTLLAFRIAEDQDVMLPAMMNLDGFTFAHTMQPLEKLSPEVAQEFIGDIDIPHEVTSENPRGFGAFTGGNKFWQFRQKIMEATQNVPAVADEAFDEFADLTGREYDLVHEYRTDDADLVLVGLGTMAREAEVAVDVLREKHGVKAGVVRPILDTPFPEDRFAAAVGDAEKVVVLDRSTSFGRGGIVTRDVELAIDQPIASVIAGIGGQNVEWDDIIDIALNAEPGETQWFGGDL